ncbi:methyltransferase domain-containing protein [Methylomonas sp. 2BW1-5-20]|uniref:methyltransferase domain-containing protein n=1 Tax=Methylomonas sp. 2BW1-5-20 TaxID=3376686 RepID=UPI00404F0D82
MNVRALKNFLKPLLKTPFHPQWILTKGSRKTWEYIRAVGSDKIVLDVGCFNKWPARLLPTNCTYIGLDYYETATTWYQTSPDVFGDACNLPVQNSVVDVVMLLDVIEHLPSADRAIQEISRVLKPGGCLILQIPFLYPLHDEPRDFIRLSHYGVEAVTKRHGLMIESCHAQGSPIETAALLTNIAIAKIAFGWINRKSPTTIFLPLVSMSILLINLIAKALASISEPDDFMPYSYQILIKKPG